MLAETSTGQLHWIDTTIIVVYLIGLLGMGVYYRKFADQGLNNYFLAGRNLKGWLNGVSNAVTCMNADVAPAYCGLAVTAGASICWFYFSRFGLALMFAGVLFAAFWRRSGVTTSPEFYELRYSGSLGLTIRTLMSLRNGLIGPMIWIGAGLLALGKITQGVIGWEQWQTLAVVVPVIMIYVSLSGYVGVVMSDLLQTILLIVSSAILGGIVLYNFGGPSGLHTALMEKVGPMATNWHPPTDHAKIGIVALLAWSIGSTIGSGGDPSFDSQKLLSCRSAREASKMYVWTELVLFLMLALLTLPALGALADNPNYFTMDSHDAELAYGWMLQHYLPPGLLGVALAALMASLMSTIDSHMNFAGQVFVNDVYQRLINPTASMRECMLVGKVVMCVAMAIAIAISLWATSIIGIAAMVLGLFYSEASSNWAQWWWWRFNAKARLTAFICGPLCFLLNTHWLFPKVLKMEGAEFEPILASIAMTTVAWIVAALVTKPEPTEKLVEFYRRCRPLGWWGPIAKECGMPYPGPWPILKGLAVSVLGMVAICSGIMMLTSVYVGDWAIAGFSMAGMAIGGGLFKFTYGPYMDEIDANLEEAEQEPA